MGNIRLRLNALGKVLLSFALALLLLPALPHDTAQAVEDTGSQDNSPSIDDMLSVGNYTEGEAIVIVDEAAASISTFSETNSIDLLSQAETLLDTSAESYAEASGDALPATNDEGAMVRSMSALEDENAVAVKLVQQDGMSTADLLTALQDDLRVLVAEPNYTWAINDGTNNEVGQVAALSEASAASGNVAATSSSNDLTDYQWGCSNTGETANTQSSLVDFDINPDKWDASRIDSSTTNASGVVAVMDTGVDYTHPDLAPVMMDLTSYNIPGGGQYGYASTFNAADTTDPMDVQLHGTHVAGIIASGWNNFGVSGVASGVKLIAVRASSAQGTFVLSDLVRGYQYLNQVAKAGVDLRAINLSIGGSLISSTLNLAATELGNQGVISVFSSGNEYSNLDAVGSINLAIKDNPYVIIINAATPGGTWSVFSNYGIDATDAFAPGTDILSTVPLNRASYFPEADAVPLFSESFTNPSAQVMAFNHKTEEAVGTVIPDNSSWHYDRNGVLQIKTADLLECEYPESFPSYSTKTVELSIPLDNVDLNKVSYIGLHCAVTHNTGTNDSAYGEVAIEASGTPLWSGAIPTISADTRFGWGTLAIDVEALKAYFKRYGADTNLRAGDDNTLRVRINLVRAGGEFTDNDMFYIDTLALGTEGSAVAYGYQSGTSMAAPMTTGATMILSDKQDTSLSKSTRASELVRQLKASTRSMDSFSDMCSTGGAIDLKNAEDVDEYVPVVETATVSTNEQNASTIEITGAYFGTSPGADSSVFIGDYQATVQNWTDGSITVSIPPQLNSGIWPVKVTNANNKTSQKGFLLIVPDTEQNASAPLFEQTIVLPDASAISSECLPEYVISAICGMNNCLYMLTEDDSPNNKIRYLLKYDLGKKTWTSYDIPANEHGAIIDNTPSMTTYQGKLLVSGFTEARETEQGRQRLLSFDAATETWTPYDTTQNIPAKSLLANCEGDLLFVGNNVYRYDLTTDTATPVASLATNANFTLATVSGSKVYATDALSTTTTVYALERNADGAYTVLDHPLALPAFPSNQTAASRTFAIAAAKAGLVITGVTTTQNNLDAANKAAISRTSESDSSTIAQAVDSALDIDTILYAKDNLQEPFQTVKERVSYAPLNYPFATAYNGNLYVVFNSAFEKSDRVIKATAMETLPQAGDVVHPTPTPEPTPTPTPTPTPGSDTSGSTTQVDSPTVSNPQPLVRTGDSPLAAIVSTVALLALACAGGAYTVRRRKAAR